MSNPGWRFLASPLSTVRGELLRKLGLHDTMDDSITSGSPADISLCRLT